MPKPEGDIIASSPIVTEDGCQPYRIVIRDLGDEFVVHTEVLPKIGGSTFVWGHYFRKNLNGETTHECDTAPLRRAWRNFEKRSRDSLGISTS
jgi:hypothetical protein